MKSLTDVKWYDSNGNLVESYDKSTATGPAILYFPTAGSKPIVLSPPEHSGDTTKAYTLTYHYNTDESKWELAWVEVPQEENVGEE